MGKFIIDIEGYGTITVKVPKKRTKQAVYNTLAETVAKVMTLVDPRTPAQTYFHPVYGLTEREKKK